MSRHKATTIALLSFGILLLVVQMAYWQSELVTELYKPYANVDAPSTTLQINLDKDAIQPLAWFTLVLFVVVAAMSMSSRVRSYGALLTIVLVSYGSCLLFEPLLTDTLSTGLLFVGVLGLFGITMLYITEERQTSPRQA